MEVSYLVMTELVVVDMAAIEEVEVVKMVIIIVLMVVVMVRMFFIVQVNQFKLMLDFKDQAKHMVAEVPMKFNYLDMMVAIILKLISYLLIIIVNLAIE